ncbi:hypothetical protein [Microbulbifer sp. TYP-18]|uniref:hypothetical protein n=1 Tax=Microbulbifer sp. TYP-18 TaxID=3230024 RepID=UPI0034C5D8DB
MKLIGSRAENEYRDELIRSHESLFEDKSKRDILRALCKRYPDIQTAYTIGWISEQGEDIYTFLIDTSLISVVEVGRLDSGDKVIIKVMSLSEYQKNLSKADRLKLAVAVDLAESEGC